MSRKRLPGSPALPHEIAGRKSAVGTSLSVASEVWFTIGHGIVEEVFFPRLDNIPEWELFFGKASGSIAPLAWAHAEYLKLHRSLRDRRVFDCPPQVSRRYLSESLPPIVCGSWT